MIALAELNAWKPDEVVYEMKIVLNGTKPAVWRRLRVPGAANLGWLHAAIQVAMGWTNSHLHLFRVGDLSYSDKHLMTPEFEGDLPVFDENKMTLAEIASLKSPPACAALSGPARPKVNCARFSSPATITGSETKDHAGQSVLRVNDAGRWITRRLEL